MNKTAETSKVQDSVNSGTSSIADKVSKATSTSTGDKSSGGYSLTCEDNLDYAMLALKGKQAAFDTACMKAANKIASILKRKLNNDFFSPNVEIPFPEVRKR